MQMICGKYQDANRYLEKNHEFWSNRNDRDRLLFICTWTKSYLINLHCVHLYIIMQSIIYLSRCTFPMIGCYNWRKDILSLTRVSIVRRYFFNLLFHLRYGQQFLRKNKIKLMFFPKSHILFAEDGRPVGPIDWWCAMMIKMTMHTMG